MSWLDLLPLLAPLTVLCRKAYRYATALRVDTWKATTGYSKAIPHTVCVGIRKGWADPICYTRVDLRDDDYAEKIAQAIADMKARLSTLNATKRNLA